MKKSTLISLICSLVAVVVVITGIILVMVMTDSVAVGKKKLILSSASAAAVYDGNPLSNSKWYLTEGELEEDHQLTVNVTGVQTTVGISENHISAKVYDKNGADVTEDYNIEYRPGMLNVKSRDLVLIAESAFKIYDGTPLTCDKYVLESEIALLSGDSLDVTVEGTITEIGKESNRITKAAVFNQSGTDVTRNYHIKTKDGTLLVLDEDAILIQTDDAAKVFDGKPLTKDSWHIASGALRPDHTIRVNVTGSQTLVGSSDNMAEAKIFDKAGMDVTDTYDIQYLPGTLLVTQAEITIKSGDADKPYDGVTLTNSNAEILEQSLKDLGFQVVPVCIGSQTEVGSSANILDASQTRILDSDENDVTDNFNIKFTPGTLKVTLGEIVIGTGDAQKNYDGTPLTNSSAEILTPSLKKLGFTVTSVFTGTQTEIGSSGNTVDESQTQIFDAKGNNVTDNFSIRYKYGTLEVIDHLGIPVFDVFLNSDSSEDVYLKETSYGDYDLATKSWLPAKEYGQMIKGNESAYYLTAYSAAGASLSPISMTITPKAGKFALPYYATSKYQIQSSDVRMIGNANGSYEVMHYYAPSEQLSLLQRYADYEQNYSTFVHENYLYVDEATKAFLQEKVEERGFDINNPNIINQVAQYIQRRAKYSTDPMYLSYNNPIDQAENPTIAFFTLKEGVCRHYALAATLLYRTIGIPARYTEGYMETVAPQKTTTITAARAHAWVEIYEEGIGWRYVEVTGSAESEVLKLDVTAPTADKKYDATPLKAPQKVTGLDILAEYGYSYEVVVSGEITEIGDVSTQVQELIIKDSDGTLLYQKTTGFGKEKFNVTYHPGNLKVYREALTFKSNDLTSKIYDGSSLIGVEEDVKLTKGTLPAGYDYEVLQMIATGSDAGNYQNRYTLIIVDQNGQNVTDQFQVTLTYGSAVIKQRTITLRAESAEKLYDGTPLTNGNYELIDGELSNGDRIVSCTVVGSQTTDGVSVNKIDLDSIVIKDAAGRDITDINYSIITIPGELKVILP